MGIYVSPMGTGTVSERLGEMHLIDLAGCERVAESSVDRSTGGAQPPPAGLALKCGWRRILYIVYCIFALM
jgi:hypothetical protein